jgi:hypothetical protein
LILTAQHERNFSFYHAFAKSLLLILSDFFNISNDVGRVKGLDVSVFVVSDISNDVGRVKGLDVSVFVVSDTRIALAPKCWFLRGSDGLSLLR